MTTSFSQLIFPIQLKIQWREKSTVRLKTNHFYFFNYFKVANQDAIFVNKKWTSLLCKVKFFPLKFSFVFWKRESWREKFTLQKSEFTLNRTVERGGEAVIFTGAQTSKGGPREQNLPLFKSYFKILPGPRSKSIILSTALTLKRSFSIKN